MFDFLSTVDSKDALAGIHFAIRRINFRRAQPSESPSEGSIRSSVATPDEEIGIRILEEIETKENVTLRGLSDTKAQEYTRQLAAAVQKVTQKTITYDQDRGREILLSWEKEPIDEIAISGRPSGHLSTTGVLMLGGYLVSLTSYFLYACLKVWPVVDQSTGSWSSEVVVFGVRMVVDIEVRLILLAMFAGGLGTCIQTITSYAEYVGNRQLKSSWIAWYVLRPFTGMILATVFYFVIRGSTLLGAPPKTSTSLFWIAGISGLVGMFSKQAIDKLNEVFSTIFRSGSEVRSDQLVSQPVIFAVKPNKGPSSGGTTIAILGGGFAAGTRVTFDGVPASAVTVTNPSSITAITPAHPAGPVDLQVVGADGSKSTFTNGYIFEDDI